MSAQLNPEYHERRLSRRLINWGLWLNYDKHVGPNGERCISIESQYREDALGDVMDAPELREVPDIPDAESMQKLISQLSPHEQYSLAILYGGAPCVMKWRRVSDHNMKKASDNAYIILSKMVKTY